MNIEKTGDAPISAQEMTSLAERTGYLQALRGTFVVAVVVSSAVARDVIGAALGDLVLLSAAYLVPSIVLETLRRRGGRRWIAVVEVMLLVDAVYLALVAYASGGVQSPLRFLVYIHIIAVTLLTSYRTGMKIAVWHALLFFVTFYAQASGLLPALDIAGDVTSETPSIFNVVPLLLVAASTTAFSSINERELRRRKSDLEILTRTAGKLEEASAPDEVASIALEGALEAIPIPRALLLASPAGTAPELLAYRGELSPPSGVHASVDSVIQKAWESHEPQLVRALDPM